MIVRRLLFGLLAVILTYQVSVAQDTTCPAIVELALSRLADTCDNMERNSACYGFDHVEASFVQPVAPDFFTQPSDRADLLAIESVQTAPLDLATQQWGVAVLNVQANVPGTLPGQAVTFILMGDAQVENRVSPDEANTAASSISVEVADEAVVRSDPDPNSTILGTLAAGTSLLADSTDASGDFVRIFYLDRLGWVRVDSLVDTDALADLPDTQTDGPSPMQAFYFTTNVSAPACNEAPDLVTIRTPENLTVDLNVNGASIQVGSIVTLKQVADAAIVITVHQGGVTLVDSGVEVAAGQMILALIDEDLSVTEWGEAVKASPSQVNLGRAAGRALEVVLPGEIDFAIPVPLDSTAAGEIIHIVQRGENLFRIALLYEASMPAIVARNNLPDPRALSVGQQLIIPNPGSGFVGLDSTGTPGIVPAGVTPSGVDCSRFRATSPLDGLAYGLNTFYWDPAPGATSYRVIVYNNEEPRSAVFDAPASANRVSGLVDQSTVGGGFNFSWEVVALLNGQPACTSIRHTMRRAASDGGVTGVPLPTGPTVPPPVVPTLSASWACGVSPGQMTLTFSGALATDIVTISYTKIVMPSTVVITTPVTTTQPGPSGTVSEMPGFSADYQNGIVSTSGGQTVFLPNLSCP